MLSESHLSRWPFLPPRLLQIHPHSLWFSPAGAVLAPASAGRKVEKADVTEAIIARAGEAHYNQLRQQIMTLTECSKRTAQLAISSSVRPMLTRKYLDEVAPEIEAAALELPVQGVIGGVPVRGFVDLLDTSGRVIDLKTAARKPTGVSVSADYAFQVATYAKLCPKASGRARVDTLVATKSPQVVTQAYTVSPVDFKIMENLYPLVGEAMREGIYLPKRSSNLCSYKHCTFAAVCEAEFGGRVNGGEEAIT